VLSLRNMGVSLGQGIIFSITLDRSALTGEVMGAPDGLGAAGRPADFVGTLPAVGASIPLPSPDPVMSAHS
jgi:hypothetical protein